MNKKLNKVFASSKRLTIDDNTKIVIMSDCHRGNGNKKDNFLKNQKLYSNALSHYYLKDFIYIELGDGDEMWEVKDCQEIVKNYLDIFKQLKMFHKENRLIMIYGNHDIVKKYPKTLKKCFYKYYDEKTLTEKPLLDGLKVYESLILNYKEQDIFLVHGHQVDLLNSSFWKLSRFLVRYVWSTMEYFGIKDPTGYAKNYMVSNNTEKSLKDWSIKNKVMLIAGHTHRPIYPKIGESLYFNDGSCIHPNGITCIEIEYGKITLVRWQFDNKLIKRKIIVPPQSIKNFF